MARRDAPSGLTGWVGYAYGRYRQTDVTTLEGFWADHDQRHALSIFGHYRLSSRATIGVKWRVGTNYPITGYIDEPASPNTPPLFGGGQPLSYALAADRNTLRLPTYSRLDIRADRTITWNERRITLFAEVANTLNRVNLRNVPYGVDRSGRVFGPVDSLLPIVLLAGLLVEF